MALTPTIEEVTVTDSGEKYAGKMHSISAKLVLKDEDVTVFEQMFTENHKDTFAIKDTMEKIRVEMNRATKRFEAELSLKQLAVAEVPSMISKIEVTP